MFCSQCGTSLTPSSKFCPGCGTAVNVAAEVARSVLSSTPSGLPSATAPPVPPGPLSGAVSIDGPSGHVEHKLIPGTISLGRAPDSTIPLVHTLVSRLHARIDYDAEGRCIISDQGSTNGTFLNGIRLAQQRPEPLHSGDVIQIGPFTLCVQLTSPPEIIPVSATSVSSVSPPTCAEPLTAEGPSVDNPLTIPAAMPAKASGPVGTLDLSGRALLKLGRAPDNDVVISHPQVSRYHALLERTDQGIQITDLNSTNGTVVNGKQISGRRLLQNGDTVQIASYRFVLQAGCMRQFDDQGNIAVNAFHLDKTVGKGIRILNDVSLAIRPREFVAIVGGSGAGKSTLLDALNGFRPATGGAVLYNDSDLYENYDAYRNVIGYVPQDDIIHRELTVYGALDYAARLRLPRDTSSEERRQRIAEVLKDLGLDQRRDTPISRLSGGQRKRVSIGVELLTKPSLFFLDEPTSGLDPSTETKMMRLLRDLANQGRTILLVTHVTGNVTLCDKVIILARGGRLAYYGPPQDALKFFKVRDFVDIYDQLETGKAEDWQSKFEQTPQFQQYVTQPLGAQAQQLTRGKAPISNRAGFKGISALRQFTILSQRNLDILARDRASLILMMMLAPVIGLTDFATWRPDSFTPREGDATQIITMMFMASLICILVGGIASMREIVKEVEIYRRERMVGLGIVPYILSKVWLGVVLALYQALVFVVIKAVAVSSMPHDPTTLLQMYITLTLATLAGMLMGLFVSAVSPNQNVAPLLIILLLVPQFLFSGGMLPVQTLPGGPIISNATATKWAFEALISSSKMGQSVTQDRCWQVQAALDAGFTRRTDSNGKVESDSALLQRWQDAQSEDYKKANCKCLGPGLFTSCQFPGVLEKVTPEQQAMLDAPKPVEPAKPGDPPPEPGKQPARPADPPVRPNCDMTKDADCAKQQQDWGTAMDNWRAQMVNWNALMTDWGDQMKTWQDQMEAYKTENNDYKAAMDKWQDEYTDWKEKRDRAVGNAEGLVRTIYDNYGSTFAVSLWRNWSALGGIMAVFFVLIFVAQKYKDRAAR